MQKQLRFLIWTAGVLMAVAMVAALRPAPTRWEYHVLHAVSAGGGAGERWEKALNILGSEGWELVAVTQSADQLMTDLTAVLKRPL